MVLTGGTEALRKGGSVEYLRPPAGSGGHRRSHNAPQVSETHGQWGPVRDMTHEVRAEPPDHRTGSAGLETGEARQRTSHPLQPLDLMGVGCVRAKQYEPGGHCDAPVYFRAV